jgi:hypothetical protein
MSGRRVSQRRSASRTSTRSASRTSTRSASRTSTRTVPRSSSRTRMSKYSLTVEDLKDVTARNIKIYSYMKELMKTNENLKESCDNISKYENIYVTSDIHSDYRTFLRILKSLKIIMIDDISDIYNTSIITNIKWNPDVSKILIVIVGDIVDGKRSNEDKVTTINDKVGNFELLLHAFIYNLRIEAQKHKSYVVFTIGNHDHETVIDDNKSDRKDIFIDKYVHSIDYFETIENRRKQLIAFYFCSPYYNFILVNDDGTYNTMFVHGGFHNSKGYISNIKAQLKYQKKIINTLEFKPTDKEQYEIHNQIWSREYASNVRSCSLIEKNFKDILIVVGHCPTSLGDEYKHMEKLKKNLTCNANETCVVSGCDEKLVFVDTSISEIFHTHGKYNVEILNIKKNHDNKYEIQKIKIKLKKREIKKRSSSINKFFNMIKKVPSFLVSPFFLKSQV